VLGVVQRFRWCPPGSYLMGSRDDERRRGRDEDIHLVTFTRGFWIADTECSQALWVSVMGTSPSAVQGLEYPVERVSWEQTHDFVAQLEHQCPGLIARLPTESEWEYACRAGVEQDDLDGAAWSERTSGGHSHPLAELKPNAWGLFDMRGNLAEWCEDGYGPYPKPVVVDPGPGLGTAHVIRGGSYHDDGAGCRIARRAHARPQWLSETVGFRLAATALPGIAAPAAPRP
jgi:formylglycine-generating enzyme required for sulfatase activity